MSSEAEDTSDGGVEVAGAAVARRYSLDELDDDEALFEEFDSGSLPPGAVMATGALGQPQLFVPRPFNIPDREEAAEEEKDEEPEENNVIAAVVRPAAGRNGQVSVYLMLPNAPPPGLVPDRSGKFPGKTGILSESWEWLRVLLANNCARLKPHLHPKGSGSKTAWCVFYVTLLYGKRTPNGDWDYSAPLNSFAPWTGANPQNKLKTLVIAVLEDGSNKLVQKEFGIRQDPLNLEIMPVTRHERLCHRLYQEYADARQNAEARATQAAEARAQIQEENVQAETELGMRSSGRGVAAPPGFEPATENERRAFASLGRNPGASKFCMLAFLCKIPSNH